MKLQSDKRKHTVNPFGSLSVQGASPGGPGVGVRRDSVVEAPDTKRRTPSRQVFGDTPVRDGPFAMMAKPLARAYPTAARVRSSKTPSGPNPFDQSEPT